jgi:hypothetical protein
MKFIPLKKLSLKNHVILNEKWLQDIIADDPNILGLGELILKDKERRQPRAGRLDLLLQDSDNYGRYEVEIQLGPTDESHIIRTIEYWDIERKKYPQYEHTAVIIAEQITARFLNVISLFNGHIPLIAIQVSAIETPDGIGLHFTKVLDTIKLGYVDEDEEINESTDRNYWENKGTKETVRLADEILKIIHSCNINAQLSYNKHYIGLKVDGRAFNFAILRPQKNGIRLEIRIEKNNEIDTLILDSNLEMLDYDNKWKRYRLKLTTIDVSNQKEILQNLLTQAYESKI